MYCIIVYTGGLLDMYSIIVQVEYQICIVLQSITGGILDMYCIIVYNRWNIRYVLYYCL